MPVRSSGLPSWNDGPSTLGKNARACAAMPGGHHDPDASFDATTLGWIGRASPNPILLTGSRVEWTSQLPM